MTARETSTRPGAETEDASPKLVGAIVASLTLIVAFGLIGGMLIVRRSDMEAEEMQRGSDEFFEHGILAASDVDRSWAEINRSSASETGGYAWIDRRSGIVRVPIDRAIDLVCAEQGKPNGNLSERRVSP
jgi:hypothetical protein